MGRYLVELYLSTDAANDPTSASARARAAATEATRDGGRVRCLHSIFVPEDQTWFLLYDASTAADVRHAVDLAALNGTRIVEAIVR